MSVRACIQLKCFVCLFKKQQNYPIKPSNYIYQYTHIHYYFWRDDFWQLIMLNCWAQHFNIEIWLDYSIRAYFSLICSTGIYREAFSVFVAVKYILKDLDLRYISSLSFLINLWVIIWIQMVPLSVSSILQVENSTVFAYQIYSRHLLRNTRILLKYWTCS